MGIYLTTCVQMTLPIIQHLGFPVANLHFNLQLFQRENLKLIILRRIFRRNTLSHCTQIGTAYTAPAHFRKVM